MADKIKKNLPKSVLVFYLKETLQTTNIYFLTS